MSFKIDWNYNCYLTVIKNYELACFTKPYWNLSREEKEELIKKMALNYYGSCFVTLRKDNITIAVVDVYEYTQIFRSLSSVNNFMKDMIQKFNFHSNKETKKKILNNLRGK